MTHVHSTAPTLLVAIDVSKYRHEVRIGVPGKMRRRYMPIQNRLDNAQRAVTALASNTLPVPIGFEATGNYYRILAHDLGQADFEMKLVSSVGLPRTRKSPHDC
mgnify:CR=1 FL=1